jgi:hypothetical protein
VVCAGARAVKSKAAERAAEKAAERELSMLGFLWMGEGGRDRAEVEFYQLGRWGSMAELDGAGNSAWAPSAETRRQG